MPAEAPREVESARWKPFEEQGNLLTGYTTVRQRLLAALARVGLAVPDAIVRREALSFCSLMHDGESPVPRQVLLDWARETGMSNEPPARAAEPEFSPGVAEVLNQWRTDVAQFSDRVRASNAAFETARDVIEAWSRVAYFTGTECGRDATEEQIRAHYVELLLALGRVLVTAGLGKRVGALVPGDNPARLIAVELLRHAVAGNRAAVAHLDGAMRDAGFVGGGDALVYVKHGLRHEVLGTKPPAEVPVGWEGRPPDHEVRTQAEFVAWIDEKLTLLDISTRSRDQRGDGADVRNAHRLLSRIGVAHVIPFPTGGMTAGEEEAHLRNLRNLCLSADERAVENHRAEAPTAEPATTGQQSPTVQLKPDEFDFGGGCIGREFPAKQLRLLYLVRDAGPAGIGIPDLCRELGYANDENGRKALGQLVSRTQERIDAQEPTDLRARFLLESRNGRYCLTPTGSTA